VLDVVEALAVGGFEVEAERILALVRERVKGDYLQPAAIFSEDMQVLSAVTDPNDYHGPGTGYRPSGRRRAEIAGIRQVRSRADLAGDQQRLAGHVALRERGPAATGNDPREICVGLSPAFAVTLWESLSGLPVGELLRQVTAGLEEEGCVARLVRVPGTIDVGLIGLTAARLAGSGVGIGLQAKGTALIHRRDLAPLANLELYSVAPQVDAPLYRKLGVNAGRHAKGLSPDAVFIPGTEEAITARYHARTVALVAIEREQCRPGAAPVDLERVG
jgi:propanediol dehydratase large subunit